VDQSVSCGVGVMAVAAGKAGKAGKAGIVSARARGAVRPPAPRRPQGFIRRMRVLRIRPPPGRACSRHHRGMKAWMGLWWALGGMTLGFVVFAAGAALFAQATQMTTREGASGYFMIGMGLIGGLLGLLGGLVWFALRAPTGGGWQQFGQGVLGLAAFAAVLGAAIWAWVYTREGPALYHGKTQANLLLEFRIAAAAVPAGEARQWLDVEVTTARTRPVALVLQDQVRSDGEHQVVPAVQGPLLRAGQRLVVARIALPSGERHEVFMPRMPRQPDPRADWSDWISPREVFDVRTERSGLPPLLQMRWRLRLYGE